MAQKAPRAMALAMRYLAYRARSRAEIEARLSRDFPPSVVTDTLTRLESLRLLDDAAFARMWRSSRDSSSPRSRSLVTRELRQKGVNPDVIREATGDMEDETNAYSAALGRMRSLSNLDRETFRRRLAAHLLRRGFSFSVSRRTVERLWAETRGANPEDIDIEEGP